MPTIKLDRINLYQLVVKLWELSITSAYQDYVAGTLCPFVACKSISFKTVAEHWALPYWIDLFYSFHFYS